METKKLDWNNEFSYPNMISIDDGIHDGSCFFHSISMATYKPYQINQIDRKKHVADMRRTLSKKLPYYYDKLANGELPELAMDIPVIRLDYMQEELDSTRYISNIYNEYISELLDIDIYLLNNDTKDVYPTATNLNLLYKNRLSIVILYIDNNHYQIVGLKNKDGSITVSFKPDHNFITYVKNRLIKKIF